MTGFLHTAGSFLLKHTPNVLLAAGIMQYSGMKTPPPYREHKEEGNSKIKLLMVAAGIEAAIMTKDYLVGKFWTSELGGDSQDHEHQA